jgi:hypothetical protein
MTPSTESIVADLRRLMHPIHGHNEVAVIVLSAAADRLEELERVVGKLSNPAFFWPFDDGETPYQFPEEKIEQEGPFEIGEVHGFTCANRLPDRYFRVVADGNDQAYADATKEEYEAALAAQEANHDR